MASDTGSGVTYWDADAELDRLRAQLAELTEAALTLRRESDDLLAALQQILDIDCEYCEGCKSAAIGQAIRIAAGALAKHRGGPS